MTTRKVLVRREYHRTDDPGFDEIEVPLDDCDRIVGVESEGPSFWVHIVTDPKDGDIT